MYVCMRNHTQWKWSNFQEQTMPVLFHGLLTLPRAKVMDYLLNDWKHLIFTFLKHFLKPLKNIAWLRLQYIVKGVLLEHFSTEGHNTIQATKTPNSVYGCSSVGLLEKSSSVPISDSDSFLGPYLLGKDVKI